MSFPMMDNKKNFLFLCLSRKTNDQAAKLYKGQFCILNTKIMDSLVSHILGSYYHWTTLGGCLGQHFVDADAFVAATDKRAITVHAPLLIRMNGRAVI